MWSLVAPFAGLASHSLGGLARCMVKLSRLGRRADLRLERSCAHAQGAGQLQRRLRQCSPRCVLQDQGPAVLKSILVLPVIYSIIFYISLASLETGSQFSVL